MLYVTTNLEFKKKLSENPKYKNDTTLLQVMARLSPFWKWEIEGEFVERSNAIFQRVEHSKVVALCIPEEGMNTACFHYINAFGLINKVNYKNTYFKIVDVEKIVQIKYNGGSNIQSFDDVDDTSMDDPPLELLSTGNTVILLEQQIAVKTTVMILNQLISDFTFKNSNQLIFVYEGSRTSFASLYGDVDVDQVIDLNKEKRSVLTKPHSVSFRKYENAIKPDWVKGTVFTSNNGKRVEVLSLPTKEDLDFLKDKEWCGSDIPLSTTTTKQKHSEETPKKKAVNKESSNNDDPYTSYNYEAENNIVYKPNINVYDV